MLSFVLPLMLFKGESYQVMLCTLAEIGSQRVVDKINGIMQSTITTSSWLWRYPLPSFITLYHPSLSFIILTEQYHPLSSFIILYHPILSFIILYHFISPFIILYHPLPSVTILKHSLSSIPKLPHVLPLCRNFMTCANFTGP